MRMSRSESGFTLIEILVVIFIVMTVLSVALLSFGILGDDRELQTEARRFAALVEVAQDEGALQGREFGIEFMTAGYRFVEYDTTLGIWVDVPNDDLLRLRTLPESVEFELYLEGKRIVLKNDPAELEDPEKKSSIRTTKVYAPHLMVFSSGESTPFELHVLRQHDDKRLILRGDPLGAVERVGPDDE
jgi:general secretion pathway protein H